MIFFSTFYIKFTTYYMCMLYELRTYFVILHKERQIIFYFGKPRDREASRRVWMRGDKPKHTQKKRKKTREKVRKSKEQKALKEKGVAQQPLSLTLNLVL